VGLLGLPAAGIGQGLDIGEHLRQVKEHARQALPQRGVHRAGRDNVVLSCAVGAVITAAVVGNTAIWPLMEWPHRAQLSILPESRYACLVRRG
jgi:hypothetical protein